MRRKTRLASWRRVVAGLSQSSLCPSLRRREKAGKSAGRGGDEFHGISRSLYCQGPRVLLKNGADVEIIQMRPNITITA